MKDYNTLEEIEKLSNQTTTSKNSFSSKNDLSSNIVSCSAYTQVNGNGEKIDNCFVKVSGTGIAAKNCYYKKNGSGVEVIT